jgi:hypothetical protein
MEHPLSVLLQETKFHTHNKMGKIRVLCILVLKFLDKKRDGENILNWMVARNPQI